MRICPVCGSSFKGRQDKRFCDSNCKNVYHRRLRSINNNITRRIDQYLHRNRTVLLEIRKKKGLNKFYVSKHLLAKMGFRYIYYTGSYENIAGKVYYYIYDFAWMQFNSQQIMVIKRRLTKDTYPLLYGQEITEEKP